MTRTLAPGRAGYRLNLTDFLKLPDTTTRKSCILASYWRKLNALKEIVPSADRNHCKLTNYSTPKLRDPTRVWLLKESAETVGRQDSEAPVRVQWCLAMLLGWGQGSYPATGLPLVGFPTPGVAMSREPIHEMPPESSSVYMGHRTLVARFPGNILDDQVGLGILGTDVES